ncbi:hypothetical protein GCM10007857_89750 [Bradyrhizobium iriomotense]|uniref:Uncharacterized protein n=1 Tax=Bradyrhizobium iriomotense TaxID=441950 RepID=A0ABQ6BEQ3_9BRAD|nr:hypothetical protein GCM10007857_89750 [Bradyrhizobium iriomotense]
MTSIVELGLELKVQLKGSGTARRGSTWLKLKQNSATLDKDTDSGQASSGSQPQRSVAKTREAC